MFKYLFSDNCVIFLDNVKIYGTARHVQLILLYITALKFCLLLRYGYRQILRLCTTYAFSTSSVFTHTYWNVTCFILHLHLQNSHLIYINHKFSTLNLQTLIFKKEIGDAFKVIQHHKECTALKSVKYLKIQYNSMC
jgi:hypothetical protein